MMTYFIKQGPKHLIGSHFQSYSADRTTKLFGSSEIVNILHTKSLLMYLLILMLNAKL